MKRLLLTLSFLAAPLHTTVQAAELQLDHSSGPTLSSQALAFSPDAKKLAVAGSDGVKIYESATGKVLETRSASGWETSSVAWSRDGKTLAAGGLAFADKPKGEIWLWREGQKPRHWMTGEVTISALAFSPDGKTLATAGAGDLSGNPGNGSARLWDATSGKLRRSLGSYAANSASVAFTPDGKRVAFSTANGRLNKFQTTLCNAATGRVLKKWNDSPIPLLMNGPTPLLKGAPLARTVKNGVEYRVEEINGADHMRYRFVARKSGAKAPLSSGELGYGAACATFGGPYLATLMLKNFFPGYEASISIWKFEGNPPRAKLVRTLGARTFSPLRLHIARDRGTLTFTTNRGTVWVDSGFSKARLLPAYEGQNIFSETAPSLSGDGKTLYDGRYLYLSDFKITELVPFPRLDDFRFTQSALSPDGQILAGGFGLIVLGDLKTGKKAAMPFLPPNPKRPGGANPMKSVNDLAWSPDSARVAVIGAAQNENRLFLFGRDGKFEREIKGEGRAVAFQAAAFSPDGKRLCTMGVDNAGKKVGLRLDVWETATGQHQREIKIPTNGQSEFYGGKPAAVAWSPDGSSIAASGTVWENGVWAPRLLFFHASRGEKMGSLAVAANVEKTWVFLDEKRIAVLNGNAIEVWDFKARQREKSLFLVPKNGEVELVAR